MSHAKQKPNRKTSKAKAYRFDARLNQQEKTLIQRAADLAGRTMTDFVIQSAHEAARRTVQEQEVMVLSARDSRVLVNALLHPPEPSLRLRKAFQHYKRTMGR